MLSRKFYLSAGEVHGSAVVLLTLLAILAASTAVFVMLIHRETNRRRRLLMGDWARSRGLRIVNPKDSAGKKDGGRKEVSQKDAGNENVGTKDVKKCDPGRSVDPFAIFAPHHPRIETLIQGKNVSIARMKTALTQSPAQPAGSIAPIWNLLIRDLPDSWPATALRPAAHPTSIADLFSLSSFPSLASNQRFMIFGADSTAARRLAESSVAALLPADIGLVLSGNNLILDFSSRTFDQIEFARMLDLGEQLAPNLVNGVDL